MCSRRCSLRWSVFVATLSAIGLLAFPAIAQKVQENVIPGLAGITDIFEIDGTLVAMDDPPVEVNGVVTMIGTGVWDWTSVMSNFGVTMDAEGLSDPITVNGKVLHLVDLIRGDDKSIFAMSDKVFHDPNTYNWKFRRVPPKDDMNNCLVWLFTDDDDDLWAVLAADRRETNGVSYVDFEFLQATVAREFDGGDPMAKTGFFTSAGTDAGRTEGDLLATIKLLRGGGEPAFIL